MFFFFFCDTTALVLAIYLSCSIVHRKGSHLLTVSPERCMAYPPCYSIICEAVALCFRSIYIYCLFPGLLGTYLRLGT